MLNSGNKSFLSLAGILAKCLISVLHFFSKTKENDNIHLVFKRKE